jgi:hypothetical protein
MELKVKIRQVLNEQYGGFKSDLEHEYIKKRKVWATYNQIILELKHSIKDMLKVKEIQYKLTDENSTNDSIIESVEGVKTFTPELERLYYKIKNF